MQTRNIDILFHIETETQFESLKPLLVHLKKNTEVTFEIIVPKATSKGALDVKDVYEGGARALLSSGFSVFRSVDSTTLPDTIINTKYQVLMSAYMYDWLYQGIDVKYRIMFPYASYYFNKPHWTIKQFINQDYLADALLSHAVGTKEVTDIFTKTYIVPSLKLMNLSKKQSRKEKPVLFFAPTYDEIDFAENFLRDIDTIKKLYTVIMRGHHRVSHVEANKDISEKLYQVADKVYDSDDCSIVVPLGEADIVVSDNSAVIFDAIYCGIPVALFSQNPNSMRYRDVNTAQSELVKDGDILWTSDPKKITHIVGETLTEKILKKQEKMRHRLFPQKNSNPIEQWIEVLSIYLQDTLPHEYSAVKQYWNEKINHQAKENELLHKEVENMSLQIQLRDTMVHNERHPGIKTAAKRLVKACLYKLHFIRRGM